LIISLFGDHSAKNVGFAGSVWTEDGRRLEQSAVTDLKDVAPFQVVIQARFYHRKRLEVPDGPEVFD